LAGILAISRHRSN